MATRPRQPRRVVEKEENVVEEEVFDEQGVLVEAVRVDQVSVKEDTLRSKQEKSSDQMSAACLPINVSISQDRIQTAATCWCLYWIWRDGAKLLHVTEQVTRAIVAGEVDLDEPAACEAYDYVRDMSHSHVIDRWRTVDRVAAQLATPLTRPMGGALPRFARLAARNAGSSGVGDGDNNTGGGINLDEYANFHLAGFRLAQQTSLAVLGIDECIAKDVAKQVERASNLLNNPKVAQAFGVKDLPSLIERYSEGALVDLLSYSDLAESGEELLGYCAQYSAPGAGEKTGTSLLAGFAPAAGPPPSPEVLVQGVRFRDALRACWPMAPATASLPSVQASRRMTMSGGVFGMPRDVLPWGTRRSLVSAG